MGNIPTWVTILGYFLGAAGAMGAALAVARSRYRDKANDEREKYIAALEARNKLLEETELRQSSDMEEMKRRHHNLEGKFFFLQELVLGKCRGADIDPESGACRHCDRQMAGVQAQQGRAQ